MLKLPFAFFVLVAAFQIANAQVTVVIENLPPSTQSNDTIFICGTFNNWVPNDKRYIVERQLNGQLSVVVPKGVGQLEYKFTRGDWLRVETDRENKMIANRKFLYGNGETVYVKVENWLDQGGARALNYIVLYFFACAFQGVALCFLCFKIQKKDSQRFRALVLINALVISLLLLLVIEEFSNPIWQGYFSFLFQLGLFCWGPAVLLFLISFSKDERKFQKKYFLGTPLGIASFFVAIQAFNFRRFDFLTTPIFTHLSLAKLLFIGLGFLHNFILFLRMQRAFVILNPFLPKAERSNRDIFVNSFYWISFVSILLVPINLLILKYASGHSFFEDFHIIGLSFTVLIFVEAFFIWRFPEILKESKPQTQPDDSTEWLDKLDNLMKSAKPYRNPELSVADLSEMLGTKAHVLSKVINERYDQNFRDFLNKYRVEEFILLANTEEYKRYTFLALAQEVGFNSKSTFNLAFKKLTNKNPRDYFKTKDLEDK